MRTITRAEQIESSLLRQLFEYWQGKWRGPLLPRRADIDPAEIPQLMPYLLLADIEHDPFRVRYRLVGTKVVEATGFEFTGRYLDEIALPDDEGPFLESYQLATATRQAVMTRIRWHLDADTVGEYDVGFLPLSDDGQVVNKVLVLESYENIQHEFSFFGRRFQPALKSGD